MGAGTLERVSKISSLGSKLLILNAINGRSGIFETRSREMTGIDIKQFAEDQLKITRGFVEKGQEVTPVAFFLKPDGKVEILDIPLSNEPAAQGSGGGISAAEEPAGERGGRVDHRHLDGGDPRIKATVHSLKPKWRRLCTRGCASNPGAGKPCTSRFLGPV
jgi:hypothetical protein